MFFLWNSALLYEMGNHINIYSTRYFLYVSLICNKQFLMMEILSKGAWFVSVTSNLSAKNCFTSSFNYAGCIINSGGK